jgi:PAS domain-containing protein
MVDDQLAQHAREVLRNLAFQEAEVRTRDGRWYLRRILPYRTVDNLIDGVVVTFVNITEVREAQRMVEAMLAYTNTVVNAVRYPVVSLNKEGRVVQVNEAFYAMFQARREDTLGARLVDIDGGRWGQADFRARLDAVIAGGPALEGYEMTQEIPRLGRRVLKIYATRTAFGGKAVAGEEELTSLTIEDVTGIKTGGSHAGQGDRR